ncbi:antibiotic biosynthesis monooxygenase [Desulfopila sp. IMCC35006]|uniref:antibiotic biosynthesis monooxygenase family protein n=1 Tax=Desulfopila sp. IMCC35006 TaxID=2569542 RepID=UPI0010AC7AA8|nr:antibiotic biosynthesis monooxygenase family protein [Desulfopila sp. IMCC35006]TKB28622.1 antibiotic biosynthesis monooxygenase [Desulfopila sp. IMCC35006]
MNAKIISRRNFRIDKKDKLIPLLKKLRKSAEGQKGFVSRSTYSSLNDPGEYLVISEWETVDHWAKWMNKKSTKNIQQTIDSLIGEKTFFDVYKQEDF